MSQMFVKNSLYHNNCIFSNMGHNVILGVKTSLVELRAWVTLDSKRILVLYSRVGNNYI